MRQIFVEFAMALAFALWLFCWEGSSSSRLLTEGHRRLRLLQSSAPEPRSVVLGLALYWVDEATAVQFEAADPQNAVFQHFCQAVNEQAGGPQVSLAANLLEAIVETRLTVLPGGAPDYQCSIVATQRIDDFPKDDALALLGDGYFVLEVAVRQQVWVSYTTPTADPLSDDQVYSIVETGFGRGAGGRVRFRSMLQELPALASVWNVEVVTAPTVEPTSEPTTASPTMMPSAHPSSLPSAEPAAPSMRPTTLAPTAGVTTLSPSQMSSSTPHPTTDENDFSDTVGPSSVVLGAIAGGLFAIFIALCCLCRVWYPYLFRHDDASTQSPPDMGSPSPSSSSQSDAVASKLIPGVVTEDCASLADSTLGDPQTLRSMAQRRQRVAAQLPPSKSPIEVQDSFDDSSLYTSLTEPLPEQEKSQSMVITKLLPDSLKNTLDFEDDIIFPLSGSGSESESDKDTNTTASAPSTSTPNNKPTVEFSKGSVDRSESTRRVSNMVGDLNDDTDESSFLCSSPVESDEEKAKAISLIIDRNSKGFDPFAEDSSGSSSFTFGKVEPVENHFFGHAPPDSAPDDRSSLSNTTTSSKDVEKLLLSTRQMSDYEKAEGSLTADSSKNTLTRPNGFERILTDEEKANNQLLRRVLEDARSLVDTRSNAVKSRTSLKSAPVEVNNRSNDLLADHLDLHARPSNGDRHSSSMSVGSPPSRRTMVDKGDKEPLLPPRTPKTDGTTADSKQSCDFASSSDPFFRPFRSRFLESFTRQKRQSSPVLLPPVSPPNSCVTKPHVSDASDSEDEYPLRASRSKPPLPVTPSSTSAVAPSPPGNLGAEPRTNDSLNNIASEDSVMHMNSEDTDLPDTPASSPGILGITGKSTDRILTDSPNDSDGLSNPWLVDTVEQTLGPRSSAAGMESVSDRSSTSGRSKNYGASTRSNSHRRAHSREPSVTHSETRESRSPSPFSRPSKGDQSLATNKSNELALEPKNLERDLKRLQIQINDVLQSELDGVSGSNISLSTTEEVTEEIKPLKKKRREFVVVVPPGKLGVVLAKRSDGKGTIVEEVRKNSSLTGMVSSGDKIVAVDEVDVSNMNVSDITKLMSNRASAERRLTFFSTIYVAD